MRNFRITFLIVGCLFVFGIYALARIPKQEFPEYTIRQGVVVGVYPGATAEEVEEQISKTLGGARVNAHYEPYNAELQHQREKHASGG